MKNEETVPEVVNSSFVKRIIEENERWITVLDDRINKYIRCESFSFLDYCYKIPILIEPEKDGAVLIKSKYFILKIDMNEKRVFERKKKIEEMTYE